ncbi:MAG: HAD-IA family hydrolase [Acidimicrobiales bacterium]
MAVGRRLRFLLVTMFIVAVATGCQADFEILVTVEDDGSGTVLTELVLDEEASAGLLDLDEDSALPLTDLAQSGWEIGRPVQDASGATGISAEKAFGTPGQFADIMDELAGNAQGGGELALIRDFALIREQSFGRVEYRVQGVIDPRQGLSAFSDGELDNALGGSLTPIVTGEPYNTRPEDISIVLTVSMPGELQDDGTTGVMDPAQLLPTASWTTDMGSSQTIDVSLRTARRSTSAQVLRGVAVVAGALAALLLFGRLLRLSGSLRRSKPAPKVRPTDALGRSAGQVRASRPRRDTKPDAAAAGYRVVALDGMGVLYREGDDVRRLLVPFARERGSTVAEEDIVAKARQLSLGRMTPADFWSVIGVAGDSNELDAAYLARHQLMPGVVRYLRMLRDSGIRAACITNDGAAWAMKLRAGHSLEGLIDPWVISGSVGVRKPDAPLFEVLRRVTGEPPASILIIDDDLANLDAAAKLGFGTAWFSADGDREAAHGHQVIRSFESARGINLIDTMDIPLDSTANKPTDGS